jgi:hypothetical protein
VQPLIIQNKMKRFKILALIATMAVGAAACSNFEDINTDPNRLTKVNPGSLLNPILYNMAVFNWNRADDFTFDLMQVSVPTNSLGGVSRYYMSDASGNSTWNTYYKWLSNVNEMEKQADALNDPNYKAIAITLRSWIYQLLTDCFGDIPMSEALQGASGLFKPKFDTQKEVYTAIINDLDKANLLFDETKGLAYNADGELLYLTSSQLTAGKSAGIAKWRKFCNSLRLRVLLRVLGKDAEMGSKAKLQQMLGNPTVYPIFQSNDDAALLAISGVFPQDAPLTRPQDFTSYRAVASSFVDTLNAWNDSRRAIFCTPVVDKYIGWPSGYDIAPSYAASNLNQNLAKTPTKVVLMSYAEVELIRAELAIRGIAPSVSAEDAYKKGVSAAIAQWGGTVAPDYFANPAVKYRGTLQQVLTQKYFALFFCDYQQWFEYLRTGYPTLLRGKGVPDGNQMPLRFKYPQTIQSTNAANYKAAVASMGADDFTTKPWWQK